MKRILYAAAMIVCCEATAAPVLWSASEGGNGHFYEPVSVPDGISWTDAQSIALDLGGHLVTLTSEAENQWVFDNVASDLSLWTQGTGTRLIGPWIGAFQDTDSPDYSEPGGGWRWVTNESWEYTAWSTDGEPNEGSSFGPENWAHYFSSRLSPATPESYWNDTTVAGGPTEKVGFIVEYVPGPSSAFVLALSALRFRRRRQPD